jgi:carbonic anhydrase/acetyltransferase-like protein (isoleucine patch superfamily)
VAGVPAKVRRKLTEKEFDGVKANAARYVELAALHREMHA